MSTRGKRTAGANDSRRGDASGKRRAFRAASERNRGAQRQGARNGQGQAGAKVKRANDNRTFRVRTTILAAVLAACIIFAMCKLINLQLINGTALAQAATDSRLVTETLQGKRGEIVDDTGAVLAQSVETYTIYADQKAAAIFKPIACTKTNAGVCNAVDGKTPTTQGPEAVAELLSPVIGMSVSELLPLLKGNTRYSVLKKNVSPAVERKIEKLNMESVIGTEETMKRTYSDTKSMGTLLGITNAAGVGVAGIEEMENSVLSGKDGKETYQRGGSGQAIPGTRTIVQKPVEGGTVKLTINSDVQWFTNQALMAGLQKYHAKWGIAVVQDVSNGQLLAVADTEGDNPQSIVSGSKAMTSTFEPGSIGKLITAANLLEHHKATATEHYIVPYSMTLDGQTYHDAEQHGDEHWTLAGIIQNSSNVGTIMAAHDLTNTQRYDFLRKFGIGVSSDIGYPGMSDGILYPPNEWSERTSQTILFGQGYSASALQMVNVAATIANGGVKEDQSLVESVTKNGVTTTVPHAKPVRVISKSVASQLLNMMESVTEIYAKAGVKVDGYRIAGKSGTAQVVGPTGQLTNTIGDWVGVIPADHPRFAIMVAYMDPTPMYGGMSAGPVMAQIGGFLMQKYAVPASSPRKDAIPTEW